MDEASGRSNPHNDYCLMFVLTLVVFCFDYWNLYRPHLAARLLIAGTLMAMARDILWTQQRLWKVAV